MKHFVLITALFLSLVAPAAIRAADYNQIYTAGVTHYQAGDYDRAEKNFRAALNKNPHHASSLFMMGETVSKDVRRLREAEGWYEKAIQEGGGDSVTRTQALFSLGVLYIRMGSNDKAIELFNRLRTESPDFYDMPLVYNHMGVAYYYLDMYDEALDSFKAALKLNSGLLEATFNMKSLQGQLSLINSARYYYRMGDRESAIEQYKKAIETYPNYVAAWYHLGVVYLEGGEFDEASKLLSRAWALNPQYMGGMELPYQLANAYAARGEEGDFDNALSLYQEILVYKDALLKAGMIQMNRGMHEMAEDYFVAMTEKAENKTDRAEAWRQLGTLYDKTGRKAEAKAAYMKAREFMPDDEGNGSHPADGGAE